MDLARPLVDPTPTAVQRDRSRLRYAMLGAGALLAGIWLAWLGAWLLGWPLDTLGIRPREVSGLVGILTAPFAHASFAHLMSNTLPIALLATLTLYNYPRAARIALPLIWLLSGTGVWLFARDSVHVGASGIAYGLMFFLFAMGLLRRDRLAVVTALVVFFLYGGMLFGVLPHEQHVSFEYHLAGAVAGLLSAFLLHRRDARPPARRYAWEDETAEPAWDGENEPPRPAVVPVLWRHPPLKATPGDNVIAFPPREDGPPTLH